MRQMIFPGAYYENNELHVFANVPKAFVAKYQYDREIHDLHTFLGYRKVSVRFFKNKKGILMWDAWATFDDRMDTTFAKREMYNAIRHAMKRTFSPKDNNVF